MRRKKNESKLFTKLQGRFPEYTPQAIQIMLRGWEKVIKEELLKKIRNPEARKIINKLNEVS